MDKKIIVLLIIVSFCIPLNSLSQEISPSEKEKIITEYRIGPRDLLEISVFGHPELSTRVRVSEEGKISFPLVGEVEIGGLTKTEVESRLNQLLREKYLQDPQVTIFILEYESKKVSVLGAVRTPGDYELIGRQTVLQIIAKAGGFTPDAGDEIVVIRENNGGTKKSLRIPIEDLILKGDAQWDIPLQPNDVVNIPIDEIVYIYVTGQVRNPGRLEVKKSNIPTLLRAIAQAGGFAERASKGSVKIKRIDETGKEQTIKVNVKDIEKGKRKDIQLNENDVVIVPETLF